MATAPIRDPGDRFQRLERVRVRGRARRRRRLMLVVSLVTGLACAGVLGVAAVRRPPPPASPRHAPTPPPAEKVKSAGATAAVTGAVILAPSSLVPAPRRVEAAPRPTAALSRPRPDSQPVAAATPDEPQEADPAEAIDWLLKRSRTTGR